MSCWILEHREKKNSYSVQHPHTSNLMKTLHRNPLSCFMSNIHVFVFTPTFSTLKKPRCVTAAQYFNYWKRYDKRLWWWFNALPAAWLILYHRGKDTACSVRVWPQNPAAIHRVCVAKRWWVEPFQSTGGLTAPNRWRSLSIPGLAHTLSLSTFPLLFCWFVYFWFPYNQEPLELRVRRDLDIIRRRQRMRGAAWARTPQACCRGPALAGCQEWLRGPSGTSLRHLTSALQLSPAMTLSRLKTHMELRQERVSGGMINYTPSYYKNISNKSILWQFFPLQTVEEVQTWDQHGLEEQVGLASIASKVIKDKNNLISAW